MESKMEEIRDCLSLMRIFVKDKEQNMSVLTCVYYYFFSTTSKTLMESFYVSMNHKSNI